MEQTFYECLEPNEQEAFISYSNSLKDLAQVFRVSKEDFRLGNQYKPKKRKSEYHKEKELIHSLFGIGNVIPASKKKHVYVKIVPTKIVGLSRVEQTPDKPRDKSLRRGRANSDIADEVEARFDKRESEEALSPVVVPS